jgi:hypothetical protein
VISCGSETRGSSGGTVGKKWKERERERERDREVEVERWR